MAAPHASPFLAARMRAQACGPHLTRCTRCRTHHLPSPRLHPHALCAPGAAATPPLAGSAARGAMGPPPRLDAHPSASTSALVVAATPAQQLGSAASGRAAAGDGLQSQWQRAVRASTTIRPRPFAARGGVSKRCVLRAACRLCYVPLAAASGALFRCAVPCLRRGQLQWRLGAATLAVALQPSPNPLCFNPTLQGRPQVVRAAGRRRTAAGGNC